MFFVLSKTIGAMLLPTNFLVGLGLAGLVLLMTRWAALGRKFVVASMLLLVACACLPLGNLLLYPLEQRFPQWDAARGAPDGIIVLGGSISPNLSVSYNSPVTGSAADRFFATAALAQRYPNARIVFTGGSANLISNDAKEGDYAGELLADIGIAKSRLTIERRSRNTYENAVFSKAMVNPKTGERWLLVTSAYHMPRSVGLFRKAGFAVEPYPVDWRVGPDAADVLLSSGTAGDALARTEIAMREWLGLAAYRLAGRTDDLFPGPAN